MMDPFKEIANTLPGQSSRKTKERIANVQAELGVITDRMQLKLDNFKHVIPDYLVSEHLTLPQDYLNSGSSGEQTPSALKPLSPGDRVVVLLISGGQEHVVTARVVSSG